MQKIEKKGLKDLDKVKGQLVASKYHLPTLANLPTLMTDKEAVELKAGVAALVEQIKAAADDITRALSDQDNLDVRMGDIRKKEGILSSAIMAEGTDPSVRKTLAETYVAALVEKAPHNQVGLNHIADQALAVGVAYRTAKDGKGVRLPVTPNGGGKWDWTDLSFPSAIYNSVRAIATEVSDARLELLEAEREKVMKGAGELLDVLAAKAGEAAFFVPDKREGDRFYGGGTIRVLVKDEKVFPLEACGKCQRVVETARKTNQGIPLPSLTSGELRFGEKIPKEEYDALRILLSIIRRGLEWAKEGRRRRQAAEAVKAKATISATDLVVNAKPGLAYLFLGEWTTTSDEKERVWKGIGLLCERNEDGEMKVVETLEKCAGLFTEECYAFAKPEEKFHGLAEPFGAIMRKLYGILARAQERNTKPAPADQPVPAEAR